MAGVECIYPALELPQVPMPRIAMTLGRTRGSSSDPRCDPTYPSCPSGLGDDSNVWQTGMVRDCQAVRFDVWYVRRGIERSGLDGGH